MAYAIGMTTAQSLAFETPEDAIPERLDKLLARLAPEISRSRVKALIEAGNVTHNGLVVEDAGAKIRAGAKLTLDVPEAAEAKPAGEAIPLTIVYEDGDLVVIDKPAGLVVHPAAGHATGTLVNALIAHCGASLSGIGGEKRPGIVHRLDKDTSGLLVVAKNDFAHRRLSRQFADHGRTGPLERKYLAIAWGGLKQPRLTVDLPIGRSPRNREKMAVVPLEAGRGAITHAEVVREFSHGGRRIASLIACRLETGRTHQIRVHMAHTGCPLLGDTVYGGSHLTKAAHLGPRARQALASLGRQALHASVLGFEHPVSGDTLSFESEIPDDLRALADGLAADEAAAKG